MPERRFMKRKYKQKKKQIPIKKLYFDKKPEHIKKVNYHRRFEKMLGR